jgi:hypothetical protein
MISFARVVATCFSNRSIDLAALSFLNPSKIHTEVKSTEELLQFPALGIPSHPPLTIKSIVQLVFLFISLSTSIDSLDINRIQFQGFVAVRNHTIVLAEEAVTGSTVGVVDRVGLESNGVGVGSDSFFVILRTE